MNNIKVNDIMNTLNTMEIDFHRFNRCNAYIGTCVEVTIGNEDYNIIPIKSYETIVAYADIDNMSFVEVGKYSRTTSKQVTQVYNEYFSNYDRTYEERKKYYNGLNYSDY